MAVNCFQAKCAAAEAASRESEQRAAVRGQTAAVAAAAGRVARLQEYADAAQEAAHVAHAEGAHHARQRIDGAPCHRAADTVHVLDCYCALSFETSLLYSAQGLSVSGEADGLLLAGDLPCVQSIFLRHAAKADSIMLIHARSGAPARARTPGRGRAR